MATVTIRPDGDGNYEEWAGSPTNISGSRYTNIDEETLDESDYMLSSSDSKKHTFTLGASGIAAGSSISSVKVYVKAVRYTPADYKFKLMIRSGTTDSYGSDADLTSSTAEYSAEWTTDPDTSAAWTISAVDALEAGFSTLAANGGGKVYQMWIVVTYALGVVINSNSFGVKRRIMV